MNHLLLTEVSSDRHHRKRAAAIDLGLEADCAETWSPSNV